MQARKRSKLELPAPQVTDSELAEIAKAGGGLEQLEDDEEGAVATRCVRAAVVLTHRIPP